MNHKELVILAEKWLRNKAKITYNGYKKNVKCGVVLTEMQVTSECPDAIGWGFGTNCSILLECKMSRADFFADSNKKFRTNPKKGMGQFRFYYVPTNLIKPNEVPENWGLIYTTGKKDKIIKDAVRFNQFNWHKEMHLLYSELRLVQLIQMNKLNFKSKRTNKLINGFELGDGI